jgi:hypothetical protein
MMQKAVVEEFSGLWWVTVHERGRAFRELIGPATMNLDSACDEAERVTGCYMGEWVKGRDWAYFTPALLPARGDIVDLSPEARAVLRDPQSVLMDPPTAKQIVEVDWEPVLSSDWIWTAMIAASIVWMAAVAAVLSWLG